MLRKLKFKRERRQIIISITTPTKMVEILVEITIIIEIEVVVEDTIKSLLTESRENKTLSKLLSSEKLLSKIPPKDNLRRMRNRKLDSF